MSSPITIWRRNKDLHLELGKQGALVLWTKIYVAPTGFEHQTPYIVGIIQFENNDQKLLEIVDVPEESLKVGQKVEVVLRRVGKSKSEDIIEYGVKAEIVTSR